MDELMTDPMILPSGNRIDRKTIAQHALSDPTDPFNRQPIVMDELKSDDDLRKKIEAFVEEKRSGKGRA